MHNILPQHLKVMQNKFTPKFRVKFQNFISKLFFTKISKTARYQKKKYVLFYFKGYNLVFEKFDKPKLVNLNLD